MQRYGTVTLVSWLLLVLIMATAPAFASCSASPERQTSHSPTPSPATGSESGLSPATGAEGATAATPNSPFQADTLTARHLEDLVPVDEYLETRAGSVGVTVVVPS